jgi:hypothetical protein
MSKKEYKKIDPALINFQLPTIPKDKVFVKRRQDKNTSEFKFARNERGTNVIPEKPTVRVVRGDLAHVDPKRDLDFFVRQSNPKRHFIRKKEFLSSSLLSEFKFSKGSNYRPQQEITQEPIKLNSKLINDFGTKKITREKNNVLTGLVPLIKEIDKEEFENNTVNKEIETSNHNFSDCNVIYDFNFYKTLCESKGNELLNKIDCVDEKVSAYFLVKYLCESLSDFESLIWIDDCEYGTALRFLLSNDYDQQSAILNPLLTHLNKLNFPQINSENLIVLLFQKLIDSNIIEKNVIFDWNDAPKEFDGWKKAIVQTSEWILKLLEENDEDSDDDEY